MPDGACTFTWPGLMNATKAGWPPIVTLVPSSAVGALMPLKSLPAQERVSEARLDP